ncbi:MAG: DUF167 domain-containing protein [Planctomycetota bacterium]
MPADTSNVVITTLPDGIELSVKVVPGASRSQVAGTWDTALKIVVAAPAEGGRANKAVITLLALVFATRKADVEILSGQTRPLKRISIRGLSETTARSRLSRQ